MSKHSADDTDLELTESAAAEEDSATGIEDSTAAEQAGTLPQHGFFVRLYTGTGAFEVIGKRRMWYAISGVIMLIMIASIVIRGFNFGIDFEGGTKIAMPVAGVSTTATPQAVEDVFSKTLGHAPESVVRVGNGDSATLQIRTETLSTADTDKVRNALFDAFQPKGEDGKASKEVISDSAVSSTWGDQITKKALIALVVFIVLVSIYITIRYERYMAAAAPSVSARPPTRSSCSSNASRTRSVKVAASAPRCRAVGPAPARPSCRATRSPSWPRWCCTSWPSARSRASHSRWA